jgi:uncharacterized membrane protein YeaQ/YmgE (transglycosylase-associated protein family)
MDAIFDLIEWLISAPVLCCGWIIFGTMAGALARRFTKAQDQPLWSDLILGVTGGVIGGFIAGLLLNIDKDDSVWSLSYWVVTVAIAIFGAMVLIVIGRLIRGERLTGEERRRRKSTKGKRRTKR